MILLKNAKMIRRDNELATVDLLLRGGKIERIGSIELDENWDVVDCKGRLVTPGFIDPHVHLREPGFTHKETIETGTRAAIKGGYTSIFAMPNVNPCPDTAERMNDMMERKKEIPIDVHFFAPLTMGELGAELTDFKALKAAGAIGVSDDGKGLQNNATMARAMELAAQHDLVISAHCEDESILKAGYIHAGPYADEHGHRGIQRACEDIQAGRDILLAGESGARYHICHMSSHRTVDLLQLGQGWGYRVSGEVTPHHLLLTQDQLEEDGNFKMNPPLREEIDRQRLIAGLREGTIKVIATDHAPHTEQEKSRGLAESPFGITGLETAFPLLYTYLVKPGHLTLETVVEAMTKGPADIFGLSSGRLEEGAPADITLIDLEKQEVIDASKHESLGRNTPFDGWRVDGMIHTVIKGGQLILKDGIFVG